MVKLQIYFEITANELDMEMVGKRSQVSNMPEGEELTANEDQNTNLACRFLR